MSTQTIPLKNYFTKEYFQKLESLSHLLRQKLHVDGLSGEKKSQKKGSSLEFSDFRDYNLGDDLRRVDWNSYARFEKMYVKLFLEETQGEMNLFLDVSLSMNQPEKLMYAKQLLASFAYIALCNGDCVNVFLWNETIISQKKGLRHKNQFLSLLLWLDTISCTGQTDFIKSLFYIGHMKKGISIVLSDFLADIPIQKMISRLQSQKQDVLLLQLLSLEECSPSIGDAIRMKDCETGQMQDIHITPLVAKEYQKALKHHQNQIWETAQKRHALFLSTNTEVPILESIQKLFSPSS